MARYIPPPLKRRPPAREPRRRFIIVCEGMNTEPAYFEALKSKIDDAMVVIRIEPASGVPMTIAKRTVQITKEERSRRRQRGARDSFEERDEVWAVFDRDEHPDFQAAINLCADHGVKVARSNPCFEVWIILHRADYHRPDGSDGF